MRAVSVVGVGLTQWGKRRDVSLAELMVESAMKAFADTKSLTPQDVEALYIGNAQAERFQEQAHPANVTAEYLGMSPRVVARVEMACSSGSVGVRNAFFAIASGQVDSALVLGVEKMCNVSSAEAMRNLCLVEDLTWESFHGMIPPSGFALIASRYMHEYGVTQEQLAKIAVKNHRNGAKNPIAQFRKEITVEDVLNSPMVAHPLNLLDCSPISDGSAAVILAPAKQARKYNDTPVDIIGSGQFMEPSCNCSNMESLTTWRALVNAAKDAYSMAKLSPSDLDIVETHDCFTIAELIEYEDLGLCKKGEGPALVDSGETEIGGRIPVNPSGGLKSKGHPVGATGVAQIAEVSEQLRGECGPRQVDGATVGMTQNLSGFATHHVCHILRRQN
ncbi:MAG: thiolase domain-containing protein [Promethearchaeota archaeon]